MKKSMKAIRSASVAALWVFGVGFSASAYELNAEVDVYKRQPEGNSTRRLNRRCICSSIFSFFKSGILSL